MAAKRSREVVELLERVDADGDGVEVAEADVHVLRRLFWEMFDAGELTGLRALALRNSPEEEEDDDEEEDPVAQFQTWAATQYNAFVTVLATRVMDQDAALAAHTLLSFLSREVAARPHTSLMDSRGVLALTIDGLIARNDDALDDILSVYVCGKDDVTYYVLQHLAATLTACEGVLRVLTTISAALPADTSAYAYEFLLDTVRAIYEARSELTARNDDDDDDDDDSDGDAEEEEEDGGGAEQRNKRHKRDRDLEREERATVWRKASIKNQKRRLSECWLALLNKKGRMPRELVVKVMPLLHTTILPALRMPLLLSDFLTDAYNEGGVTSLQALDGLFYLMSRHNLDYPDFYAKLYALLDTNTFLAAYRARFFVLLDLFLSSPMLPLYVVTAFMKKLARLSLTGPPHACQYACVLIHNLVLRYPSTRVLFHRPVVKGGKTNLFLLPTGIDKDEDDDEEEEEEKEDEERALGEDPFKEDEKNPKLCDADKSSLWELRCLENHYNPKVASLAKRLMNADKASKLEIEVAQYVDVGYSELFEKELSFKKSKDVAIAFEQPAKFSFDM